MDEILEAARREGAIADSEFKSDTRGLIERAREAAAKAQRTQAEWDAEHKSQRRDNDSRHLTETLRTLGILGEDAFPQDFSFHHEEDFDGPFERTVAHVDGVQFCFSDSGSLMARAADDHQWQYCSSLEGVARIVDSPKLIEPPAPPLPPHVLKGNNAAFSGQYNGGLSKREYFAACALQGLLSADIGHTMGSLSAAEFALFTADELLKALTKSGDVS